MALAQIEHVELTFAYDEQAAYGFVPEQLLHVAAPPFKRDVP